MQQKIGLWHNIIRTCVRIFADTAPAKFKLTQISYLRCISLVKVTEDIYVNIWETLRFYAQSASGFEICKELTRIFTFMPKIKMQILPGGAAKSLVFFYSLRLFCIRSIWCDFVHQKFDLTHRDKAYVLNFWKIQFFSVFAICEN